MTSPYTVWFSRQSAGPYSAIATVTTTSYLVYDTGMGGYYRVSASPTALSNTALGLFVAPPCPTGSVPRPCPTPPPLGRPNPTSPTNVAGTPVQWYAARLTWTAPTAANDVHVLRSYTSGGPYTLVASVDAGQTSYNDYVSSGATYYYVLQSKYHYVAGSGSCQQIYELSSGLSSEVAVCVPNDFFPTGCP